jgi:hypothetical protein
MKMKLDFSVLMEHSFSCIDRDVDLLGYCVATEISSFAIDKRYDFTSYIGVEHNVVLESRNEMLSTYLKLKYSEYMI